jgi:hypothetical protein
MKIDSYSRYLSAQGNTGDAVIALALAPLLAAAEVREDAPVFYKPGGLSHHGFLLKPILAQPREQRIIVLPSSIDDKVAATLARFPNLHVHCRGRESLAIARKHGLSCELTHDIAFSLDYSPWKKEGTGVLRCFRTDLESATNHRPVDNRDISSETVRTFTPENCTEAAHRFIGTIAGFAEVETDRLHVGIVGAMLGKKVRLFTGIDHKVREVYEFSLAGFANVELVDASASHRGVAPKAVIIHQSHRPERYPGALRAELGNTRLQEALCPTWEASRENIAIRGCALSHLHALRHHGQDGKPLLILEDDAEIIPPHYEEWLGSGELPPDCGAVLLGGDVHYARPSAEHPDWYEVYGTYWGTHAVVYNLPLLKDTDFLVNMYVYLASNQIGPAGKGISICYEYILRIVLEAMGLKLYCRERHAFTTRAHLESTRCGKAIPPRFTALKR